MSTFSFFHSVTLFLRRVSRYQEAKFSGTIFERCEPRGMGAPRREPPAALSSRVVSGKVRLAKNVREDVKTRLKK